MGNEVSEEMAQHQDAKEFADFLKERKKRQSEQAERSEKYNFSPELKWRSELVASLEQLGKKKCYEQLCQDMLEIVKKIKIDNYIKAISILTAMNSQQVMELSGKQVLKESFNYESCRQSEHVFLDLGSRFAGKDKESVSTEYSSNAGSPEKAKKNNNNRKGLTAILVREFNQQYHPIRQLKDAFAMIFQMKYRCRLNEITPLTESKCESLREEMHADLRFYCEFITNGCAIYRKWVVKFSKIRDEKYPSFMKGVIMDSLFTGPTMHNSIFPILKEMSEEPVRLMLSHIRDNMGVDCFHINAELQIEGNFVLSLLTLEDMDRVTSPRRLLDTLENLKEQICNDIDQFHQLFKTNKSYKIDGDNLLGILCFLLCRMKPKLLEMYTQIMLLLVVYGDSVNTLFESASYMVTAFQASFDHFSSDDFADSSS